VAQAPGAGWRQVKAQWGEAWTPDLGHH